MCLRTKCSVVTLTNVKNSKVKVTVALHGYFYSLGPSICACVHYTFLNDKISNCYLQLHETRYLGAVSICDLANCKCHFNASNTGKLFNVETIQCRYKRKFPCCATTI